MEAILAIATLIGGLAAFWFFGEKISAFFSSAVDEKDLADFIRMGQELHDRSNEDPLPVKEHNDWVERMNTYFLSHKGADTRFASMTSAV